MSGCGSGTSISGRAKAWSCSGTRSCWRAAARHPASNADPCSAPRSTPASATSRLSNSSSGPARARKKRWKPRCSRPRAKPETRSQFSEHNKKRRGFPRGAMIVRDEALLVRFLVRIDDLAGRQILRRQHGLIAHAAPGLEVRVWLDVVILHLDHAAFGPFAFAAEFDRAHDRFKAV